LPVPGDVYSLVFDQISSGKKQRILATHALQFLFLGFTGFRFPCAHFPSTTASGYELYTQNIPLLNNRRCYSNSTRVNSFTFVEFNIPDISDDKK
jgi:hypothetical protein